MIVDNGTKDLKRDGRNTQQFVIPKRYSIYYHKYESLYFVNHTISKDYFFIYLLLFGTPPFHILLAQQRHTCTVFNLQPIFHILLPPPQMSSSQTVWLCPDPSLIVTSAETTLTKPWENFLPHSKARARHPWTQGEDIFILVVTVTHLYFLS